MNPFQEDESSAPITQILPKLLKQAHKHHALAALNDIDTLSINDINILQPVLCNILVTSEDDRVFEELFKLFSKIKDIFNTSFHDVLSDFKKFFIIFSLTSCRKDLQCYIRKSDFLVNGEFLIRYNFKKKDHRFKLLKMLHNLGGLDLVNKVFRLIQERLDEISIEKNFSERDNTFVKPKSYDWSEEWLSKYLSRDKLKDVCIKQEHPDGFEDARGMCKSRDGSGDVCDQRKSHDKLEELCMERKSHDKLEDLCIQRKSRDKLEDLCIQRKYRDGSEDTRGTHISPDRSDMKNPLNREFEEFTSSQNSAPSKTLQNTPSPESLPNDTDDIPVLDLNMEDPLDMDFMSWALDHGYFVDLTDTIIWCESEMLSDERLSLLLKTFFHLCCRNERIFRAMIETPNKRVRNFGSVYVPSYDILRDMERRASKSSRAYREDMLPINEPKDEAKDLNPSSNVPRGDMLPINVPKKDARALSSNRNTRGDMLPINVPKSEARALALHSKTRRMHTNCAKDDEPVDRLGTFAAKTYNHLYAYFGNITVTPDLNETKRNRLFFQFFHQVFTKTFNYERRHVLKLFGNVLQQENSIHKTLTRIHNYFASTLQFKGGSLSNDTFAFLRKLSLEVDFDIITANTRLKLMLVFKRVKVRSKTQYLVNYVNEQTQTEELKISLKEIAIDAMGGSDYYDANPEALEPYDPLLDCYIRGHTCMSTCCVPNIVRLLSVCDYDKLNVILEYNRDSLHEGVILGALRGLNTPQKIKRLRILEARPCKPSNMSACILVMTFERPFFIKLKDLCPSLEITDILSCFEDSLAVLPPRIFLENLENLSESQCLELIQKHPNVVSTKFYEKAQTPEFVSLLLKYSSDEFIHTERALICKFIDRFDSEEIAQIFKSSRDCCLTLYFIFRLYNNGLMDDKNMKSIKKDNCFLGRGRARDSTRLPIRPLQESCCVWFDLFTKYFKIDFTVLLLRNNLLNLNVFLKICYGFLKGLFVIDSQDVSCYYLGSFYEGVRNTLTYNENQLISVLYEILSKLNAIDWGESHDLLPPDLSTDKVSPDDSSLNSEIPLRDLYLRSTNKVLLKGTLHNSGIPLEDLSIESTDNASLKDASPHVEIPLENLSLKSEIPLEDLSIESTDNVSLKDSTLNVEIPLENFSIDSIATPKFEDGSLDPNAHLPGKPLHNNYISSKSSHLRFLMNMLEKLLQKKITIFEDFQITQILIENIASTNHIMVISLFHDLYNLKVVDYYQLKEAFDLIFNCNEKQCLICEFANTVLCLATNEFVSYFTSGMVENDELFSALQRTVSKLNDREAAQFKDEREVSEKVFGSKSERNITAQEFPTALSSESKSAHPKSGDSESGESESEHSKSGESKSEHYKSGESGYHNPEFCQSKPASLESSESESEHYKSSESESENPEFSRSKPALLQSSESKSENCKSGESQFVNHKSSQSNSENHKSGESESKHLKSNQSKSSINSSESTHTYEHLEILRSIYHLLKTTPLEPRSLHLICEINSDLLKNTALFHLKSNDLLFCSQIIIDSVIISENDSDCNWIVLQFENINRLDDTSVHVLSVIRLDTVLNNPSIMKTLAKDRTQIRYCNEGPVSVKENCVNDDVFGSYFESRCRKYASKIGADSQFHISDSRVPGSSMKFSGPKSQFNTSDSRVFGFMPLCGEPSSEIRPKSKFNLIGSRVPEFKTFCGKSGSEMNSYFRNYRRHSRVPGFEPIIDKYASKMYADSKFNASDSHAAKCAKFNGRNPKDASIDTNNLKENILQHILRNKPVKLNYLTKRNQLINVLIQKTADQFKNDLINNYYLSTIEQNIIQKELFHFMTQSISELPFLFKWKILLLATHGIRNLHINFFLESQLELMDVDRFLGENEDMEMLQLFAFNFPTVFRDKASQKKANRSQKKEKGSQNNLHGHTYVGNVNTSNIHPLNNITSPNIHSGIFESLNASSEYFEIPNTTPPNSNLGYCEGPNAAIPNTTASDTKLGNINGSNHDHSQIITPLGTNSMPINKIYDKRTFNIDRLLIDESTHKQHGMSYTFRKSTNGFLLKGKTTLEESIFNFTIEINKNIKKTMLSSDLNIERKLHQKINHSLKKSNKFIEILGQWKMEIDSKLLHKKECLICYMVIAHDRSLPDFKCKICRNMFHKACLRKWVGKKQKAICPIDRQPI